jgi:hypothetical protein
MNFIFYDKASDVFKSLDWLFIKGDVSTDWNFGRKAI